MALQNPQGNFNAYGEDAVGNLALTVIIAQTQIPAPTGGGVNDKGNEVQVRDIIVSCDRASQNTKVLFEVADNNNGSPGTFFKRAAVRVPDYGNNMRSYTGQIKIKAGQWFRVRYIQGTIGAVEVQVTGDTAVSDIIVGG